MAGQIEIIGGHSYYVERDKDGNIIRQDGRDTPPSLPVVALTNAEQVAVIALCRKPAAEVTAEELAQMMQFVVKRTITG